MSHAKGHLLRWAVIAGLLLGALLVASAEAQNETEPTILDVTFQLGGPSCQDHIVQVESALLRVRGVAMVDIEKKKGHVVVGYDPSKVSVPQLLQAAGSARGKDWSCTAQLGGS
jgi:copper chaperone CopZ